jgi:hypothetical protein
MANATVDRQQAGTSLDEDLILYKLRYFRISRQSKHVRDIASIMLTLGKELELDYIASWSERLGLTETWQEVMEEVRRMSETQSNLLRWAGDCFAKGARNDRS